MLTSLCTIFFHSFAGVSYILLLTFFKVFYGMMSFNASRGL